MPSPGRRNRAAGWNHAARPPESVRIARNRAVRPPESAATEALILVSRAVPGAAALGREQAAAAVLVSRAPVAVELHTAAGGARPGARDNGGRANGAQRRPGGRGGGLAHNGSQGNGRADAQRPRALPCELACCSNDWGPDCVLNFWSGTWLRAIWTYF